MLYFYLGLFWFLSVLWIGYFFYRPKKMRADRHKNNINVVLAKEKINQLAQDKALGLLADNQYQAARQDIVQTLAGELDDDAPIKATSQKKPSQLTLVFIAVFTALLLWFVYAFVGNADLLEPIKQNKQLLVAEKGLQTHLQQRPDDALAWATLARLYFVSQRYPQAIAAFGRAYQLDSHNEAILLAYITSLIYGGELTQAEPLLVDLLSLSPEHSEALWLSGYIAYQKNNYDLAERQWQKTITLLAPDNPQKEIIARHLAKISAVKNSQMQTSNQIRVSLQITAALRSQYAGGVVHIYVKNSQASQGAPIAIKTFALSALPDVVTLTDNDVMVAGQSLGNVAQIIVSARLAKTMQLSPQDKVVSSGILDVSQKETVLLKLE